MPNLSVFKTQDEGPSSPSDLDVVVVRRPSLPHVVVLVTVEMLTGMI